MKSITPTELINQNTASKFYLNFNNSLRPNALKSMILIIYVEDGHFSVKSCYRKFMTK